MTDLASLTVTFGAALREAGVPTTLERSGRWARAVDLVNPLSITDLYWTARITLVTGHLDLDAFDRVFAQVFRGMVDVADQRGDPASPPVSTRPATARTGPPKRAPIAHGGTSTTAGQSAPDGDESDTAIPEVAFGAASREERLATTDFAELDDSELADLQRLMHHLRISPPLRKGRRPRRHRQGDRLDLRATLRRSRHSGGDPVVQIRRRRRHRPRRLVMLCDISGSMEPYARAYVSFLHAAATGTGAEVFTFATRLTRLTPALALARPQQALGRAAEAAPDWRGGTRIGEALKSFIDEYGRRGMARSAVVLIVSDGWECDDPAVVGEQMERLARLAHRIVWVNPRTADPRYQPLAGGMAAALPHCDALVSGHTLAALDELIATIAGAG